jgi:hypothetical protein
MMRHPMPRSVAQKVRQMDVSRPLAHWPALVARVMVFSLKRSDDSPSAEDFVIVSLHL